MDKQALQQAIAAEFTRLMIVYPFLSAQAARDMACGIVYERTTPAEEQARSRRNYAYEREEVRAEGRYPTW